MTAPNTPPGQPPFHFTVDGRPYQSNERHLSGAQIKALAGVDAAYQLYEEGPGNSPDRAISDAETVQLTGPQKQFYAVPPATFG